MTAITRLIKFLRIGVGISNTDVEYADSTSSTVAPTAGWQTTAPKWVNGHFIWTRTHITYTDGREQYSEPVCLPSGKGIASIVEQYYSSTSGQSLTGGYWSNTPFAWVNGRYIWTRSVIHYTDGTTETTQPICYTGSKGEKGDPGQPGKDGADGTSIALRGDASGHFASCEQLQQALNANPSRFVVSDPPMLIDNAADADKFKNSHDNGVDSPSLITIQEMESGNLYYSITKADLGACYVYGGEIYSNTGKAWYNLGQIQGPKGDPGDDGIDATQYYVHVAWCNTPDNSDGSFTVECSDGDAYAYMGTCVNTTKPDPKTFNSYRWVKVKGDQGNPGKDAVTISMSLTAIAHKKSATDAKYASEVKVYAGDKQVPFSFSHISSDPRAVVTNVQRGDGRIFYVTIRAGAVVNGSVTISIAYGGKTYQRVISITTAEDGAPGAKGEVGATLRGPQDWARLGVGYTFEAGGEGDEWKDVVVYNNQFYSCIKDHVKTANNYPGSDVANNNGYWRLGSPIELIVAKIILSQYQLVENLGVKIVEMKDDDGNVIFKVRDGEVTCKKGTFENINASGIFKSRNPKTWNEIEMNADAGEFVMRGPSNVDDDDHSQPSSVAELMKLFSIHFETDPDSLGRVTTMEMYGCNRKVRFDTIEGISYTDALGNSYYKSWEEILN